MSNVNDHLKNLTIAESFWKTQVDPEAVDLALWCGTKACFGGHLVRSPHFAALGLCLSDSAIAGEVLAMGGLRGSPCGYELFGSEMLFHGYWKDVDDPNSDDEYQIVLNRIACWRAKLLEQKR